ncbi:MAG: cell division protein [Pseudomonadota bacterium]
MMDWFSHRTRGFRTINVLFASALLVLAIGVNLAKTFAGKERTQIGRVERDIGKERDRIRVLEAEVAHLEQPERLERLSRAYLAMEPVQARQEATEDGVIAVAQQGANGGARATQTGGAF